MKQVMTISFHHYTYLKEKETKRERKRTKNKKTEQGIDEGQDDTNLHDIILYLLPIRIMNM
jgi:hypothetical protein